MTFEYQLTEKATDSALHSESLTAWNIDMLDSMKNSSSSEKRPEQDIEFTSPFENRGEKDKCTRELDDDAIVTDLEEAAGSNKVAQTDTESEESNKDPLDRKDEIDPGHFPEHSRKKPALTEGEGRTSCLKPEGDKPSAKPPADKPPVDKPPAEKPPAGKPAAEKPPADKPAAEKPNSFKPKYHRAG